jgi:hypothetical protein
MHSSELRVERSLYKRAVGYTYEAVKVFQPRREGAPPLMVPYKVHQPADPKAAVLWLEHRRFDRDHPELKPRDQSAGQGQVQQEPSSPSLLKICEDLVAQFPHLNLRIPEEWKNPGKPQPAT